jgi:hypothetical protein
MVGRYYLPASAWNPGLSKSGKAADEGQILGCIPWMQPKKHHFQVVSKDGKTFEYSIHSLPIPSNPEVGLGLMAREVLDGAEPRTV